MVDVVHTSDWHLGFLHGKHPKPVSTLMQEIVKPCKYARENGIQHVIVSGDICHSYIMSPDVQRAIYRLADKYKDLMFWMIPGNHDYHSKNVTSLEALFETTRRYDNLRIILQPSVEQLDGVPFTFLPFPYVERVLDTQSVLVGDVGVDLGSRYIAMAQHRLDRP
jgi:DNA repair exonuclease SbcCD nuclease subunit